MYLQTTIFNLQSEQYPSKEFSHMKTVYRTRGTKSLRTKYLKVKYWV